MNSGAETGGETARSGSVFGLAMVLPGEKKVVDEGKLKKRAPGLQKQRLKDIPIKPLVVRFKKAGPS